MAPSMKIAPEYQRIRALQDGQQQARLEPPPAQPPAAAALPAAQPAAPAPAQPAPVADPPVRRSVVLPKGPPRMGLVRVQLHMDEPPRRFGAALKQWGAEHAGEGYWWLDLPEEAAARRIEWADLNKVPWYISETRKNIPSGTPAPPRLD